MYESCTLVGRSKRGFVRRWYTRLLENCSEQFKSLDPSAGPCLSNAFALVEVEADLCSKPLCTAHTFPRDSCRSIYTNRLRFLILSFLSPLAQEGVNPWAPPPLSRCQSNRPNATTVFRLNGRTRCEMLIRVACCSSSLPLS